MDRKKLGRFGEKVAVLYLKEKGFRVIERNFRTKRWGELDVVTIYGDILVFVEVKTRTSKRYGEPYEALNFYKKRSLRRAARYYKLARPETPERLRFDLVSVLVDPFTKKLKSLEHFENIFENSA